MSYEETAVAEEDPFADLGEPQTDSSGSSGSNGSSRRVRTRRVLMSPDRAKILLQRNTCNRQPSPRDAAKLSRIMMAKEWEYNGEAIKISETGKLLDGQHRLMACAAAGVSFDTLVIENLPDRVFSTLDQGRRRSGGDVLFIKGVKRYAIVAQVCASIYRVLKNKQIYGGVDRVPSYGIEKIYARHPGVETSVEFCLSQAARGDSSIVGVSQLAAFHYVIDTVLARTEDAASFVEGLVVGAGLEEDDPLLRFRNRVSDMNRSKTLMHGQDKTALLTKIAGMHLNRDKVGKKLNPPSTSETYFGLIPGLAEAVEALGKETALADMDY